MAGNPMSEPTPREETVIYCTGCNQEVEARLTNGAEHYPSRPDLADLPFWTHDTCNTWVGTHYKTEYPTRPLGVLATYELVNARKKLHALLDPLWKSGKFERRDLYAIIGKRLGRPYHNAEIRSIEEAEEIKSAITQLKQRYGGKE